MAKNRGPNAEIPHEIAHEIPPEIPPEIPHVFPAKKRAGRASDDFGEFTGI